MYKVNINIHGLTANARCIQLIKATLELYHPVNAAFEAK